MKTIKVEVTQEHISRGKRGMCRECPVALALKDVFPGKNVVSSLGWTSLDGNIVNFPCGLPDRVGIYDRTGEMEPFGFELNMTDEQAVNLGVKDSVSSNVGYEDVMDE